MAPDNTPSTPPPYSYPTPYVHDVPTHVGQKVSYTNSGGGFAAMTGGMGVLKAMARQNVLEKLSHVGGNSGGNSAASSFSRGTPGADPAERRLSGGGQNSANPMMPPPGMVFHPHLGWVPAQPGAPQPYPGYAFPSPQDA